MSDSEPKVKVTDKRMFTADGELREGFRHLDSEAARSPAEPEPSPPAATDEAVAAARPPDGPQPTAGSDSERPAGPEPGAQAGQGNPTFLDLLGLLAEPIALFLGDARLPDGRSTEDLRAARFHIDLLEVIRQKTAGNLSAEESALLEDLLYRLRLRYVQKTS